MPPIRMIATVLLMAAVIGCAADVVPSSTERPFPNSVLPVATPGPGPDVDCSLLLTTDEITTAFGVEVTAYGWNLNSCYWSTGTRTIQLELQTGPSAGIWFAKLRESGLGQRGMDPVGGYDFEALAKPGSFGGFVPGRAALFNGIDDEDAAGRLIRLVLTRL
jgi:hypothetical protein